MVSLLESIRIFRDEILRAQQDASRYLEENPQVLEGIANVVEQFQTWPDWQRELWAEAARNGWYVNWHTPITINRPISEGKEKLDTFMIDHLTQDVELIQNSIILAVSEREQILRCAFELHAERRYIASVPLFMAQADGICAEHLGAHLFSERESRQERLSELLANSSAFAATLLSPLGVQTQFEAGINKFSSYLKTLAPNRNGVLHGSRRHLDYGTEVNSLKAFSLLAFIVFAFTRQHESAWWSE